MYKKLLNTGMQPWLKNARQEFWLIMAPAIIPVITIIIFKDFFTTTQVTTFWWILLVMAIDVGHVYSTLFRLYWDNSTVQKYKTVLFIIPVLGFILGFSLHLYDSQLFWRVLAYIAIYHFIRQQYGFMKIYSRKEIKNKYIKIIDALAIYSATLYPIIYWHLHLSSSLSWFVKGDILTLNFPFGNNPFFIIYCIIALVYIIKESWTGIQNKTFNLPKNLVILGTYLSWYVGIIMFQGDLIFTLLNVVAHGIPYMGLIWIHGEKKNSTSFSFSPKGALIFMSAVLFLAYVEEGLWDIFVWKDHPEIFPFLISVNPIQNPILLSLVVSALVLPQLTHYVLDGFIWRFSKDEEARI